MMGRDNIHTTTDINPKRLGHASCGDVLKYQKKGSLFLDFFYSHDTLYDSVYSKLRILVGRDGSDLHEKLKICEPC